MMVISLIYRSNLNNIYYLFLKILILLLELHNISAHLAEFSLLLQSALFGGFPVLHQPIKSYVKYGRHLPSLPFVVVIADFITVFLTISPGILCLSLKLINRNITMVSLAEKGWGEWRGSALMKRVEGLIVRSPNLLSFAWRPHFR